jgi:hypothetical protein
MVVYPHIGWNGCAMYATFLSKKRRHARRLRNDEALPQDEKEKEACDEESVIHGLAASGDSPRAPSRWRTDERHPGDVQLYGVEEYTSQRVIPKQ